MEEEENPSTTLLQQSGKNLQESVWIVLQKNRSVMTDEELPTHSRSFVCILLKGLPSEAQVLVLFLLLGGQFKFASWEGDAWVDSRHLDFPFLL